MFDTKTYKTILILADGTVYYGWSFKPQTNTTGEVVFNTGMTGYQEIMTDPSYAGQIITFTYPEIGNTGINLEDNESRKPFIKGIISKNLCLHSSNWRSTQSLGTYLKNNDIAHIYGIDTRALTKHLRKSGTMNGCISTEINKTSEILEQLQKHQNIEGIDIVKDVISQMTTEKQAIKAYTPNYINQSYNIVENKLNILIIDFGVKYNIIRSLQTLSTNINISVLPANTDLNSILSMKPDGILLSNGPGDPSAVSYAIETVKDLIKQHIPIFGICMGHQILSLALGFDTFKLKFGHRGLNHPVGYKQSINMSSQNHGFAVSKKNKVNQDIIIHETNYNDQTLASVVHRYNPYLAVQYHPEASPGPHDSIDLFKHFINIVVVAQKYPQLKNLQI
uniref:Carbamoyl phosphate synthase small chain n=1 Tax=Helminthora furcellata TaxID=1884666 RepID=A0A1G4NQY6_9FLOR|nr:Carbamoyl phosphate synthase small subunit [Helminthora furcellata]SCW21061.1 Carbamoyl phosphate synthase small subunit [Helminthora furcellata]SCW23921.1 Carbamoyl phosphate synthase small subunit [Helminthora furcellata]